MAGQIITDDFMAEISEIFIPELITIHAIKFNTVSTDMPDSVSRYFPLGFACHGAP